MGLELCPITWVRTWWNIVWKKSIYIYDWVTLLYSRDWSNIVNTLIKIFKTKVNILNRHIVIHNLYEKINREVLIRSVFEKNLSLIDFHIHFFFFFLKWNPFHTCVFKKSGVNQWSSEASFKESCHAWFLLANIFCWVCREFLRQISIVV